MKIIVKIFPKKFLFGGNRLFWAQKWLIFITLDLLQEFSKNFAQ